MDTVGQHVFGWIGTVGSLLGLYLNAKKLISCWYVWIFSNAFWIGHSIIDKEWYGVVMWSVFEVFNLYGLNQWKEQNNAKKG